MSTGYLLETDGPAVVIVLEFERQVRVLDPADPEAKERMRAWIEADPQRKALLKHAAQVALATRPSDDNPSPDDLRGWLDL